jgi:hypothetical protein
MLGDWGVVGMLRFDGCRDDGSGVEDRVWWSELAGEVGEGLFLWELGNMGVGED